MHLGLTKEEREFISAYDHKWKVVLQEKTKADGWSNMNHDDTWRPYNGPPPWTIIVCMAIVSSFLIHLWFGR